MDAVIIVVLVGLTAAAAVTGARLFLSLVLRLMRVGGRPLPGV